MIKVKTLNKDSFHFRSQNTGMYIELIFFCALHKFCITVYNPSSHVVYNSAFILPEDIFFYFIFHPKLEQLIKRLAEAQPELMGSLPSASFHHMGLIVIFTN